MKTTMRFSLTLAATVALVACGGGGSSPTETPLAVPSAQFRLPHTGVTSNQCYQAVGSNTLGSCNTESVIAYSGSRKQDGMYPDINAMNYSKIDVYGNLANADAGNWCALKANVTGLMWQVHNDGDNHDAFKGGYEQAQAYATANTTLCGLTGWRLPTIEELESLLNIGNANSSVPAVKTDAFPYAKAEPYWTSSNVVDATGKKWIVNFLNGSSSVGEADSTDVGIKHYVRLVRDTVTRPPELASTCRFPEKRADRFTQSGTEVADKRYGLVWQRCSVGQTWNGTTCTGTPTLFTHDTALQHVAKMVNWRLPNRRELFALADQGCSSDPTIPAIDAEVFPATTPTHYWTSSPSVVDPTKAWITDFSDGSSEPLARLTNKFPIRLVRTQ